MTVCMGRLGGIQGLYLSGGRATPGTTARGSSPRRAGGRRRRGRRSDACWAAGVERWRVPAWAYRAGRNLHRGARDSPLAVIEYAVTGLLAWWRGQSGQVGNEAATAVFRQCRGLGSSPPPYLFSRRFRIGIARGSRRSVIRPRISSCLLMHVRPSRYGAFHADLRRRCAQAVFIAPGRVNCLPASPVLWVKRPHVTDTILQ
jgi:hypothetical protein